MNVCMVGETEGKRLLVVCYYSQYTQYKMLYLRNNIHTNVCIICHVTRKF